MNSLFKLYKIYKSVSYNNMYQRFENRNLSVLTDLIFLSIYRFRSIELYNFLYFEILRYLRRRFKVSITL